MQFSVSPIPRSLRSLMIPRRLQVGRAVRRSCAGGIIAGCVLAAWSAVAQNQAGVLEVPFRFEQNEILVRAKIGTRTPFTALLDTDTNPSVIDVTWARSVGLTLRKIAGEVTGGGSGRPEIYITKIPGLIVGALPAKDLQAAALDLGPMRERLGADIKAVLGGDFLARRIVQIDYPRKVVRFYPSSFLSAADAQSIDRVILPFDIEDDDVVLKGVSVNGRNIKAALDTGSDGSFKLTPAAVDDLGLTAIASKGEVDVSVGYKGEAQNTQGTVDRITVGSIELKSPAVVFFGRGTGRDKRPWGLNIGNEFLRDYVVTLDYQKKLVALERP